MRRALACLLTLLVWPGVVSSQYLRSGSTPQGDYLRGLGIAAWGLGSYELNSARANEINTKAAIEMDTYVQATLRAGRENSARIDRAAQQKLKLNYEAIRKRIGERPETRDVMTGDALNALMDRLNDPSIQESSFRGAKVVLPVSIIRRIPFKLDEKGIIFSIQRLTARGNGKWPVAFQENRFAAERVAYDRAIDNALEQMVDGKVTPDGIEAYRVAVSDLSDKLELLYRDARGDKRYQEAKTRIHEMEKATNMLKVQSIQAVMAELDRYAGTTVNDLRLFMRAHNLRFALAESADERRLYPDLYAALIQVQEIVNPRLAEAERPMTNAARIMSAVATLFLVLFAMISTLIIGAEGRAYRQSLRPEKVARSEKPRPAPDSMTDLYVPEDHPNPPAAPLASVDPPQAPALAPEPTPRPAETIEKTTPKPPTVLIDPFWTLPAQTRVWDLEKLTVDDERQLGADLHQAILHEQKALEIGPLPRRLEEAAEPFLEARARKEIPYTLTVLDSDESNIFSHPGGYIYVTRGLFDWISEEETYVLEFALAHEIAHVDRFDAIDCLRGPDVKSLNSPTLALVATVVIPWGYKDAQDLEADRWATLQMIRLGRSRHATMAYLSKLGDFARVHGFENKRRKPTDDPNLAPMDNHIRAHLIPRNRLKAVKTILDSVAKPR